MLLEDFFQLPLIGKRPFYFQGELKNKNEINGRIIYYKFNRIIKLTIIQ